MATKTSILLFYISISQNYRLVQWGNWITLFVVNACGIILAFLVAFQCKPVIFDVVVIKYGRNQTNWWLKLSDTFLTHTPSTTKCIGTYALIYASAPVNFLTDLSILILPMPILTSLRLPKKQKIILIGVFAAGGL